MPAERLSRAQRVRMERVAEREIQRYAHDHALWHKHVHNVELDPVQVLKMLTMDRERNTIDFSCRRTRKTSTKELYFLKDNACHADQELGIVAPREKQSLVNLNYHLEAIERSAILNSYMRVRNGREQKADTYYQFANRSKAEAYGIMAQIDGGDLTAASLEEVDDMPRDRLYSRFLLMMGATQRLGASKDARNEPQVRITGVYKGADTLAEMVDSGTYHVLPTIDVHVGIEMGIIQRAFMANMAEELTPEEYIRQLLCRNVSAKNFIWEKYLRLAMTMWLKARLAIAEPLPGHEYKHLGMVSFGYDAGAHGEGAQASKHTLVVAEEIGEWITFPYVRSWPATADDSVIKRDLISAWRYFRPDYALGDAYAVGMLTELNDDLYREGLSAIDRRTIGEGESSATTWPDWAFSPIRFQGQVKHNMASALRAVFHHSRAALPSFGAPDVDADGTVTAIGTDVERDFRLFARQLTNVVAEQTKASYPAYKMKSRKLGDDFFDASMAAVWGLATRGQAMAPAAILSATRSREQLLLPSRAA